MGGASKILTLLTTPFPLIYPRPSALLLTRRYGAPLSLLSSAAGSSGRRLVSTGPRPLPDQAPRPAEQVHAQAGARESFVELPAAHPWPEWTRFLDHVAAGGYTHGQGAAATTAGDGDDDSIVEGEELTEEFSKAAEACLAFARQRRHLLRLLPKKDIEVIVENGSPFLFKNGENSARRLRSFLNGGDSNLLQSERAETFDVMRYLLSYASNPCSSIGASPEAKNLSDASVRNLLVALADECRTAEASTFSNLTARQPSLQQHQQQFSRPSGPSIEMKRGDWICPKCSFMNFARNMKCLECAEMRPKRVLTSGEWECPRCNFFNYGRNMSCLRCGCRRPSEIPMNEAFPGAASLGYNRSPSVEQILSGSSMDKAEIEKKLTVNDEKAERWLSKLSQLDDSSDSSSLAADDDFPEIMPMRKGVNRFVVSTRKTPLERRLANAQYNSNSAGATTEGSGSRPGCSSGPGANNKSSDSSFGQTLDRILGRSAASPAPNVGAGNHRRDLEYVPFVPLPADMFAKSQNGSDKDADRSISSNSGDVARSRNREESSDAAQRWPEKAAEPDNVGGLSNAVSGQDFPEIMPMRKGENRFVVSKTKDQPLTSPQYKRRIGMEQAKNTNFVPFVPFPPDYFAKKDKPSEVYPTTGSAPESSQATYNDENRSIDFSQNNTSTGNAGSSPGYLAQQSNVSGGKGNESWNNGFSCNSTLNASSNVKPPGYPGKSLEGSAVKEPDPLDMSEEAKAERWFRRAAQIKDISELANIPDEDFPEIMPLRKGVNRFVVSKRKTPLERRLTSPQYRRNLPIIRSEAEKDAAAE